MNRELLITDDGSHTIFVSEINEHYHSTKGAIQEALHVFINAGFNYIKKTNIRVLEVGFGTGLNALLTLNESILKKINVYYETIEAYPLPNELINSINYSSLFSNDLNEYYNILHLANWNELVQITSLFSIKKINIFLENFVPLDSLFDVIYFDAFSPKVQPELWTQDIFAKMFKALNFGGVLVTYSSKGTVKDNLRNSGFDLNRLKGAGGKYHMLRAIKV